MEEVGVMVPFIKAFLSWHIIGFCILLVASGILRKIIGREGGSQG